MGMTKGIEIFFMVAVVSIVLLSFLSVVVPVAQETIDNAPAGTFAMAEGSKLMLGLIGFMFVAGGVYAGIKEMLAGEERTRVDGYRWCRVCYLAKPSSSDWVDLTVSHKGELHVLHKFIQEEQGVVDCYV